ncbi:hypothetical protein BUE80_DR002850 [Diplocarpon rosae]|nr:hypothetical protein BUE80_DR002850 [Diplocarpon rosae]
MCYHKRTVYICKHNSWGRQVLACNIQKLFLDGTFPLACDTMNGHPLHSHQVEMLCPVCSKKQTKTLGTLSKLKAELKEATERLARHRKKAEVEEDQNSLTGHAASVGIEVGEFKEIIWSEHAALTGFDGCEFDPIVL